MGDINKAVKFMIDTANNNYHGYDQANRNGPDYDCSSLVGTALHEGGFAVSPYSVTWNLEKQLRAAGFSDCIKPWKPGDIHLNTQRHVCMSINSEQIAQASINEKGTVSGGQTGDQTGNEINIKNYYEYKYGWDVHLRYEGNNVPDTTPLYSAEAIARQVIAGRWGNGDDRKARLEQAGYDYDVIQSAVNDIVGGKTRKTNYELAREVINGQWKNYPERKILLEAAGYDYNAVQDIVDKMLS